MLLRPNQEYALRALFAFWRNGGGNRILLRFLLLADCISDSLARYCFDDDAYTDCDCRVRRCGACCEARDGTADITDGGTAAHANAAGEQQ